MTTAQQAEGVPELQPLIDLLRGRPIVVLAGAGCSTDSGIPDYRGLDSTAPRRAPVQYQEFMGAVIGVITQNVDGLHHSAGSRRVIELHGSLAWVVCTQCNTRVRRATFQSLLLQLNLEWAAWSESLSRGLASAPDGDVELPVEIEETFRVQECAECGGIMKPDVVFFGENVPRAHVDEAWRLFEECDVLLVAGSSLTVYSGRRFVYAAAQKHKDVALVTIGATRVDDLATIKVDSRLGRVMPILAEALTTTAHMETD